MRDGRKLYWGVGVVVFLVLTPLVLSLTGIFAWSPVNCWHYDVDINSGRIRYTRYVLFIPFRQEITESALSRALKPEDLPDLKPDWKRALTFSPGTRTSPHYTFHGALEQIRELEVCWQLAEFTPTARQESAKRVLELWKTGETDFEAGSYLQRLSQTAGTRETNRVVDASDLPN